MLPELSKGTCQLFKNAQPDDPDVFNTEYTVQFLFVKKVGNTGVDGRGGFDRYRIIMSDGTHYMQAMLATQLNSMVEQQQIMKGSIVVLEKLTCNYVQEKRYALCVIIDSSLTTAVPLGWLLFLVYASSLLPRRREATRSPLTVLVKLSPLALIASQQPAVQV